MKRLIKSIVIAILMGACGHYTCPTYAQDITFKVFKKGEIRVNPGDTILYRNLGVAMDANIATKKYIAETKLEELEKSHPQLQASFDSVQKAQMKVLKNADSLSAAIDSLINHDNEMLEDCEGGLELATNVMVNQRQGRLKAEKEAKIWRRIGTLSLGGNGIVVIILLVLI